MADRTNTYGHSLGQRQDFYMVFTPADATIQERYLDDHFHVMCWNVQGWQYGYQNWG